MPKAEVFHGPTLITTLTSKTVKGVFNQCQGYFGHCLGATKNTEGRRIGWKFARCGTKMECVTEIYNVRLYEED